MRKIFAVIQKEIYGYTRSPIAYIVLVVTIAVFNIFFFMIVDQGQEATLRDVFRIMEFLFVFIVPLLTMKVYAEEKASGTMEFLMTTPASNAQIVVGKYLGSLLFLTLMIAVTGVYYGIIEYFGVPDRAVVAAGYLGIWLEGALFVAVSLWMSSMTRSQIIAAISSYLVLFLLYFSGMFAPYLSGKAASAVLYLSTQKHAENFFVGILTVTDIVYYSSGIILCVVLTRLSIETRFWR